MASQLAETYITVAANAAPLNSSLGDIRSRVSQAVGDMANRFAMTGFVFRRLVDMAKEFAYAIAEDEEEVLKFDGATKAAGRGSYFKSMVADIGAASEATTKFSSDAVRAAGTAIARFETLSDDTLGQVLKVAKDLTAQFGGDLVDNARKLAMAMERPELSGRMLRQMGVNLTSAQNQQLQEMLKAGRLTEAQTMLLSIASSKAAGAAERLGGTLMSLWTRIKTEVSELSEAMGGKMIDSLKSFGDASIKGLRYLRDLVEGDTVVGKLATMAGGFLGLAAAGGTLGQVFSTVKGLLFGTLGPIGWITAGIVALGTQFISIKDIIGAGISVWQGIVGWWNRSSAIIDSLKVSFAMLVDTVSELFARIISPPDWSGWWATITNWASAAATAILEFTVTAIDALVDFVDNADIYWQLFKIRTQTHILSVIAFFQDQWPQTTAVLVGFAAAASAIFSDVKTAIVETITGIGIWISENIDSWARAFGIFGEVAIDVLKKISEAIVGISLAPALLAWEITPEKYKKIAKDAADASLAQGSSETRRRLAALKEEEDRLNKQIADRNRERQRQKDEEEAARLQDLIDDEFFSETFWAAAEEVFGSKEGQFGGKPGGKAVKPEKESTISTGFVGVAEFAKQFQAAILKKEDQYAKETAKNTKDAAEAAKRTADNTEDMSPFGSL